MLCGGEVQAEHARTFSNLPGSFSDPAPLWNIHSLSLSIETANQAVVAESGGVQPLIDQLSDNRIFIQEQVRIAIDRKLLLPSPTFSDLLSDLPSPSLTFSGGGGPREARVQ